MAATGIRGWKGTPTRGGILMTMRVENSRPRPFEPFLLFVLGLPLSLAGLYLYWEHSIRRSDSAFSLLQAQVAFRAIREQSLFSGLLNIYFGRGYRPILHPFLSVPFFFLTGGDASLAADLCVLSLYALFLFFVYRLLREYLDGPGLWISALLVGLSPAVVKQVEGFPSELSLMAFFVMFLFYLKRSRYLASPENSLYAGISLGIAFCVRPVETLLYAGIILLFFGITAFQKSQLKRMDLIFYLSVAAIYVGTLYAEIFLGAKKIPMILANILPWFMLLSRARFKYSRNGMQFFGVAFFLPALWYLPVTKFLGQWLLGCTYSSFAEITGARAGVSQIQFLLNVAEYLSWPLIGLLAALLFGVDMAYPSRVFNKYGKFILPAIALAVVPAYVGSLTYNGEPRYYLLSGILFELGLLILIFLPRVKYPLIRAVIPVLAVVALLGYRVSSLKGSGNTEVFRSYLGGPLLRPPLLEDQVENFVQGLERLMPRTLRSEGMGPREVRICVLQMANEFDTISDPWTLGIVSYKHGALWNFEQPFLGEGGIAGPDKLMRATNEFDYILIVPLEFEKLEPFFFSAPLGEHILKLFAKRDTPLNGLERIATNTYKGNDGKKRRYMLLKTLRADL